MVIITSQESNPHAYTIFYHLVSWWWSEVFGVKGDREIEDERYLIARKKIKTPSEVSLTLFSPSLVGKVYNYFKVFFKYN